MKSTFFLHTPIGEIGITQESDYITALFFSENGGTGNPPTNLLSRAAEQLDEYFAGKRQQFILPLLPQGTEFQNRVWEVLCTIPYGQTLSYMQVAQRLGNPNAARAVGMANNKNPIPILIPCHRVIGSNRKLTGYAGGLEIKEKLLTLEQGKVLL